MALLESVPPEATASMQRDVMAGRPSELEAQIGAVVRLGRRLEWLRRCTPLSMPVCCPWSGGHGVSSSSQSNEHVRKAGAAELGSRRGRAVGGRHLFRPVRLPENVLDSGSTLKIARGVV